MHTAAAAAVGACGTCWQTSTANRPSCESQGWTL